jgi:hypothetical protein
MRRLALLSTVLFCFESIMGCDDYTAAPASSSDTMRVSFQDGLEPNIAYNGTADAIIKDGSNGVLTNGNFGAADSDTLGTVAIADGFYERRLIIKVDLSSITSCSKVVSAQLSIRITPPASGTITLDAHRVIKQWVEGTGDPGNGVSWTTIDGVNPWTAEGGDFDGTAFDKHTVSSDPVATFSLPPIVVKSWIFTPSSNHGVIIKTADTLLERYAIVFLSEYERSDWRPRLDVTYIKGG